MPDSLRQIIDSVQTIVEKRFDVIEKVDAFYNNAWTKLIVFGSILFALVGIFVPVLIQWFQKRTLKLSEENLKTNLKAEILNELSNLIDQKFKDNEEKLKILNASANSKILYSQAKFSLERNSYKGALGEIVTASNFSLECNDFKTLQELLDFLLNYCLPNLSIEEINDLKTANVCDLQDFLEILTSKDDRGMFQTKIGEIKVKLTKLPKTVKLKSDEKNKSEE